MEFMGMSLRAHTGCHHKHRKSEHCTHTYIEYIEFCLNTSKFGYSLYHTAHIFQIQDEFHSEISRSEHKLNRMKRNLAYHYQRYLYVTFSGIELRLIENKNKIKKLML